TKKNTAASAKSAQAMASERSRCRRFASSVSTTGASSSFAASGAVFLPSKAKAMFNPERAEKREEIEDREGEELPACPLGISVVARGENAQSEEEDPCAEKGCRSGITVAREAEEQRKEARQ